MTCDAKQYARAAAAAGAAYRKGDLPASYADPIAERRENPKPRVRVKAGSSK